MGARASAGERGGGLARFVYHFGHCVAASHFFIGLGAGMAILTVPMVMLTPGLDLPNRFVAWIDGPPPQKTARITPDDAALSRPARGYKPGDPTPVAEPPPTVIPAARPTPVPRPPQIIVQPPPAGSAMRTGVIRSGGLPVYVRRVAGVESLDDSLIADGAPVLVSTGGALQVGDQQWRAVRGLNGIAGWVLSGQVVVDGEAPPELLAAPNPSATPTGARGTDKGRIANTDGLGVVLRNSPNEADRSRSGLLEGTRVTVMELAGADWVRVRADNGLQGWIPARYLTPAN